jgi:arylformamidase
MRKILFITVVAILLIGIIDYALTDNFQGLFQGKESTMSSLNSLPIIKQEFQYGSHPKEALDVYSLENMPTNAPIIIMLHGGGWTTGDKANRNVFENKIAFWVPQGYLFVSVNTPLLSDNPNIGVQVEALANAISYAQNNAADWGGDASNIIVMGHSSGAHIVAMVSATRAFYPTLQPWRGTVLLDSGALDLITTMEQNPSRAFQNAFGTNRSTWEQFSPLQLLTTAPEPTLIVCSSLRHRRICDDARAYAEVIQSLGGNADVYPAPLNHADINRQLGLESDYTSTVNQFIKNVLGF